MVTHTNTTGMPTPTLSATPTWRQSLRNLPRESRDTLFLLLVVAWVMLPQVSALPVWASCIAGGALLWRSWLAWYSKPLPGKWVLGALLLISVAGTLMTHRTVLGQEAGLTLTALLLALKTLELRARRDALVVFFLGFFSMLTNFFFSQSMAIAAAMIVGLLGLLTALVNAHMPVGRPPLGQSARIAGRMMLLGTPLMLALFVLFPRLPPLWGVPTDETKGKSGLSDSMRVGSIAELALDDSIAMRISFDLPDNAVPPQSEMYFRGPVLSVYNGQEWRAISDDFPRSSDANLELAGTGISYQVTMEPSRNPWVMTLEATPRPPKLPGKTLHMSPELLWYTYAPIREIVRYQAVSYTDFRYGPRSMTPELVQLAKLPPSSNPRTVELAAEMRKDPALAQADTATLVAAVMQRLRTGGYTYTLEPGVFGQHTADEFWFDRKEGFCEHIASSFVILMRALGVPARIVTGYQGGERNPVDNLWTVRQSDAHAWAEVWQGEEGWVRVDPTSAVAPGRIGASQRLQAPQGAVGTALTTVVSPAMLLSLRSAWEAVNNGWNQWVLNYTQSSQFDMLKKMGFSSPNWIDLARILATLVGVAGLAGAAWARWDRSRQDPWLLLLGQARERLLKMGLEPSPAATARAMAQQMQDHFGDSATPASRWLLQLEALRYAPSTQDAHHTTQQLAALRREFKQLAWPTPRAETT